MTVAVMVLAAGRGERLGAQVPKAFVTLRGKTLIERSLEAAAAVKDVRWVIPVVGDSEQTRFGTLDLAHIEKLTPRVIGGAERQDSVRAGLEALESVAPGAQFVGVHDAARCLVRSVDIARVIAVARESGAALLAHRVRDTLKRVEGDRVVETPDRSVYWAAQTPQVFRVDLLREAVEKAAAEGFLATDDAQLVERLGAAVRVVEGPSTNLKITLAEDLDLAEAWLCEQENREDGDRGSDA